MRAGKMRAKPIDKQFHKIKVLCIKVDKIHYQRQQTERKGELSPLSLGANLQFEPGMVVLKRCHHWATSTVRVTRVRQGRMESILVWIVDDKHFKCMHQWSVDVLGELLALCMSKSQKKSLSECQYLQSINGQHQKR